MTQHWHVVENTPGYLPESDPATFDTEQEARDYAKSLADEFREEARYRKPGAIRSDGFGGYVIGEPNSGDLGRVIEVMVCEEQSCIEGEVADE